MGEHHPPPQRNIRRCRLRLIFTRFCQLNNNNQFRLYVGLLTSQPVSTSNKETQSASDDDDDLEEEMAAYNPLPDTMNAEGGTYPLLDPSEAERQLETREERAMRVFLENPERALKIFFTSYFIEKGLMWYVVLFFSFTTYVETISGRKVVASTPQSSSGSFSHS